MPTKALIILASARKSSDTAKLVNALFDADSVTLIDLLDYSVSPYRYDGLYPTEDNFLEVVDLMLLHDRIVFATPVYWYAMSGLMKTFFDRFTDIVTVQKDTGRQLKGKQTFLLAVGADDALPLGFEEPFRRTSLYLGMEFIATLYCEASTIDVEDTKRKRFVSDLLNN
ncbi:NAD(P)H-dependent oxidoreductase [Pontibacter sp. JH31]|uniref:NAD(P)H-dependent oxidoreductase n=1 Tax=Pontibacter aquaedesilientis TaxID=2766980 RepID=A0ABR7XD75_9BACT|nr:NAD(P)H-dependent oxidoreductase [Pontibacter aquaedesilientis]MBD1396245.1 NAD(P)H-dependent oxidoreductase [Pontibacter aquaedesilientis]